MKHRIFVAATLFVLGGLCVDAIAQTSGNGSTEKQKPSSNRTTPVTPTDGQKRFQTNCGRCHNPPEDISPREARAVVRHMRVRAMLSAQDEKQILEFLAP
jgi:cytochrome c5